MEEAPTSLAGLRSAYAAYAEQQTFAHAPATLYDPIRYAMGGRGKAVRPLLLLQSHALGGTPPERALPAAYAVELFHNFTLLHDDIMDDATVRRGRAAVHVAFDTPTAILAGDAMLIRTYGYLLDNYPEPVAAQLLSTFQPMATALCEGQQRDMDMEAGYEATYEDYLVMIHGKTGVLITAAIVMGAQIAGLDLDAIRQLRVAGDLAGRAFQIQDDLLDTFRTTEVTGKPSYGDVVRGKQSAPYVRALELADDSQADALRSYYAMGVREREPHIETILALYGELAVEKSLAEEVGRFTSEALAAVRSVDADAEAREGLCGMVERLATRAK